MKQNLCLMAMVLLACTLIATSSAAAVDFSVVWNKTYGGPDANDSAYALLQQPGGRGYLFAGDTGSFGAGERDAWVVNLTRTGDERWNRTFGGGEADTARALISTTDGNYLFVGSLTYVTRGTRKDTDVWVVKFDPEGEIVWNRTFGGAEVNASAYAAAETRDGGYVVAGTVAPWGSPATDILVLKLNASGGEEWRRIFGEPGVSDAAYSVAETTDGNITVAGSTESFGAFVTDVWVAKLDPAGNEVWNRTFGGPENDTGRALVATPDGGLVFAGSYMSRDAANRTEDDALVVKMGPDGGVVWNWTYGDAETNESAEAIIATADGGYLFVGESGKDPAGGDAWVVKLDSTGGVEGSITVGGANPGDRAASVVQVSNVEYAFAGTFNATEKDGAVETDAWVVKLSVQPQAVPKPPEKPPKPPKVWPPKPRPTPTVAPASIGDFVWNDTNTDGIQNPGEPGLEGVNVTLLDTEHRKIATTETGADGRYLFANLMPGDYIVEFVPPEGMVFTTLDAGDDDTRDSDANRTTGMTEKITLKAGEKQVWWDAGLIVPQPEITGQVDGRTWIDANEDGIQDGDEPGLPGASVTLYHTNDTPANATTTGEAGTYLFTGLPQGDYYLVFGLPEGYTFTAADQGSDDTLDSDADPATGRTENFTLTRDETEVTRDAGAVPERATIGDFVWNDTDANGIQDDGEPGFGGVTVRLLDAEGSPVTDDAGTALEATTGDDGRYALQGRVGQTYILEFVLPEGVAFTTPNAGDDPLDSDADPETGRTGPFELTGDDLTRDAGVVVEAPPPLEPGIVTGTAWDDTNANGARDAGEPGIPGLGVELVGADGAPAGTTTTGDDGGYTFNVDEPGTYLLRFTLPEGFGFTAPGSGSDVDPATGTTDTFDVAPSGTVTRNAGLVEVVPEEEGTPPVEETMTPEETPITPEETETGEQPPPADLNVTPGEAETGEVV